MERTPFLGVVPAAGFRSLASGRRMGVRWLIALLFVAVSCSSASSGADDASGSTTTIGYWYTDWECPQGFVVSYLTTNDPEINAAPPSNLCDDVMAFDVVYREAPGVVERLSDGARLTLVEEYVDGLVVASYAVEGTSESPIRCDDPWPFHERGFERSDAVAHRLVEEVIVSVERPCPSEEWQAIARLDG